MDLYKIYNYDYLSIVLSNLIVLRLIVFGSIFCIKLCCAVMTKALIKVDRSWSNPVILILSVKPTTGLL